MQKTKTNKKKAFVNLTSKNSDHTKSHERIINAYYNYYNTPSIDPFFIEDLKHVARNQTLKVSISDLLRREKFLDSYTNGENTHKTQVDVFNTVMRKAQHLIIHESVFMPLPFGMGELSIRESFSGMYSTKRTDVEATKKVKNKAKVIPKTTRRYATNTKGRQFRLVWYKAKVRHSHARYYKFKPCLGGIDTTDPHNPIYYGMQGLAARIAETNMNPLEKDFTGNYL